MSDAMMFDIARMPYEMAMDDELSRRQFYQNTQRLAAALEAARAEVVKLRNLRADALHECALANVRAERLAEALGALRDAHEALADAANTMYGICGESQFCDSCNAFERANQWLQDWHGGDPLFQQITAALEQESNDA